MSTEKKTVACYGVVLAACILFFLWLLAGHTHVDDRFELSHTERLELQLLEEGKPQIYGCVLPEDFISSQSLLFRTTHAAMEVLVDGVNVYTYGEARVIAGKSPGTFWHAVDLPADSAGKMLTICLTPAYSDAYDEDLDIRYGSRGDCILMLVGAFLPILLINFAIVVMALISLLLFVRTAKREEQQTSFGFLWIGLFSLTLAAWSLRQCGFLQFLLPSGELLYYLDIHLLFLLAPPLNLFVYSISRINWKKGYLYFAIVYLAGVVLGTVLQLTGLEDIFELLPALHLLYLGNALFMLWAIAQEVQTYPDNTVSRFRVPFYTLILFGFLEIASYYTPRLGFTPTYGNMSLFLPLGAMLFILMLVWQQVEGFFQSMLEEKELQYYEKLANTDMLTGALSRNAYENKLGQLLAEPDGAAGYAAVLLDLNNLKQINDNFGHERGDDAIKRCYELILTAFGDSGDCYRIGGDEFVFLAPDGSDLAARTAHFEGLLLEHQANLDYPFSVALGHAVFDGARDRDIQDTIRRSDAMMYQDKKRKKASRGSEPAVP